MSNIIIYSNDNDLSNKTKAILSEKLLDNGFTVNGDENPVLIICIGGDGSFLRGVRKYNFPTTPFVGINTGTLGFYQEILLTEIDKFIDDFKNKKYINSKLSVLTANIPNSNKIYALNEFMVKAIDPTIIHLDVYIDGNHLERFAGDGLIISTPAGSTAYNFSVGGSILYQELRGFQMAPLAPINSKAYRSLLNSVVMPETAKLTIVPDKKIQLVMDGITQDFHNVEEISFNIGDKYINKLVFDPEWYWLNIKDKFL